MNRWIPGLASAIVPGVGQLMRRRWGDGLLFMALATWLHLILGGLAWGIRADVVWGALSLGGFLFPTGTLTPTVTVTTVLMIVVHLYAAWDAVGDGPVEPEATEAEAPAARGDG